MFQKLDEVERRYESLYHLLGQPEVIANQEELQKFFDTRPDMLKQFGASPEPLYAEGNNTIPVSEFAFRVKGLFTPKSGERLPVLNVLEPSPVLTTRQPPQRLDVPACRLHVFGVHIEAVDEATVGGPKRGRQLPIAGAQMNDQAALDAGRFEDRLRLSVLGNAGRFAGLQAPRTDQQNARQQSPDPPFPTRRQIISHCTPPCQIA